MKRIVKHKKTLWRIAMVLLLLLWGIEYVVVKICLNSFSVSPLSLVFIKYSISLVILCLIKLLFDRKFPLKKKDILPLILCAIFGDILYFFGEYTALTMLNISTVTIFLAFVPIVSVFIELILFKVRPSLIMILMGALCIIGVALVSTTDFSEIFTGKALGIFCIFLAVISWNVYNFITEKLSKTYKPFDLTLLQAACALLIALPFFLADLPSLAIFTKPLFLFGISYLGIVSACICFILYIKALDMIGATSAAMFSNFLPVTSSFFGFLILKEHLDLLQICGGIIVIASGIIFIKEKGKITKLNEY